MWPSSKNVKRVTCVTENLSLKDDLDADSVDLMEFCPHHWGWIWIEIDDEEIRQPPVSQMY